MSQPVLIFDSNCTVCCRQVQNLKGLLKERFRAESFRDETVFKRYPQLDQKACEEALQFLSERGRVYGGAEAVAQAIGLHPVFLPLKWTYYIPGIRNLWDSFYRLIARNRIWISGKLNERDNSDDIAS